MKIIHDNGQNTPKNHETSLFDSSTGEILSNDRHDWEKFKLKSTAVSKEFKINSKTMIGRSERMFNCANSLEFETDATGNRKLKRVWFCKDRMCPHCQQRRSLVIFHQVKNICTAIAEDNPNYKYILLTLTVPNVEGKDLADKISEMAKAWGRMVKRKEFIQATKGWFRTLEVTFNGETYHPHYHVLICVPSNFFTKNYIKQARWLELWQQAMKDDSITQVDVRKIKPNPKREGSDAISSAAAEVGKYATKPSNYLIPLKHKKGFIGITEPIQQLAESLTRRKLVAFGGLMLEYSKKLNFKDVDSDDIDLIHTDGESELVQAVETEIYRWNVGLNAYLSAF